MKIFVFGSSLTSCYWNGAATYYRGIYKNLTGLDMRLPLPNLTSTIASKIVTAPKLITRPCGFIKRHAIWTRYCPSLRLRSNH